jgi:hypothetical protein
LNVLGDDAESWQVWTTVTLGIAVKSAAADYNFCDKRQWNLRSVEFGDSP